MVCCILPVPFAEAARQAQFEALQEALAAADDGAVLLGNLAAFAPVAADALLVRPDSIVWLSLTPRAGLLTVPADPAHPWLLDGQALPNSQHPNPLTAFLTQQPQVLAWLAGQLGRPTALLPPCRGLALLEAPLSFDVEVEAHLDAAGADFELLGDVSRLLARLRQPPVSAHQRLPVSELHAWGQRLSTAPQALALDTDGVSGISDIYEEAPSATEPLTDWLRHQLRQLWRWLGAEDVPADPPYGSAPPLPGPDPRQEAQLRLLRQELQAELRQQAAMQAAAHQQHLAALRQQPVLPPPLTARLPDAHAAQETARDAARETALRAAQTELAIRNRELDVRIQQLGQLVAQLQTSIASPQRTPETAPQAAPGKTPDAVPASRMVGPAHWLRPAGRLALAGLAVAAAGAGIWQVGRSTSKSALPSPAAATLANGRADSLRRVEAGLNHDFLTDDPALAAYQAELLDTTTQRLAPAPAVPSAAPTDQEPLPPSSPARADSTAPAAKPGSPPSYTAADSTTSPTP